MAVISEAGIESRKKSGKLSNLLDELEADPLPESLTGIGHTRWATHGGPTDQNAHPHLADEDRLAVIHNGIIENFAELRASLLAKGYTLRSETDTEVAAVLLGDIYRSLVAKDPATATLAKAMQLACQRLEGAFTLLAIHQDQPDVVVAARRNSPLVVGLGEGENFLGSDVSGFIDFTRRAVELEQDQIVTITPDAIEITDFFGNAAQGTEFEVNWDAAAAEKGGYPSFMEKEINDQPEAVGQTLLGRSDLDGRLTLDELRIDPQLLKTVSKIIVLACGTSAYAGQVAKYAIEHWCRIPVEVELSHEFRYRDPIVDANTLIVAISQSGETMDTLMAVRYAKEQGAKVMAICNTNGSTIPREADAVLYTHAGRKSPSPRRRRSWRRSPRPTCWASTWRSFAATSSRARSGTSWPIWQDPGQDPEGAGQRRGQSRTWPGRMADTKSVLFLGRHVGFPVAMEGALKLKELAYIHAEGFAAGELKHGPIALIEDGQPVFVMVPSPRGRDSLHAKVVSNIQEIRARGAKTIVIAEEGDEAVKDFAGVRLLRAGNARPCWPRC